MLDRVLSSLIYRAGSARPDTLVRAASDHFGSASYRRLRHLGFRPGGIIDIGAHQGNWTREVLSIFPNTPTLMIEARTEERDHLERTVKEFPNVSYEISLLGSKDAEAMRFAVSATGSSIFEEQSNAPRTYRDIPMRRLDDIVMKLRPPFFLKLDVQGAELEVLRGGYNTLKQSEIVQLEVPFLTYNKGAPDFSEVMNFMNDAGFVPFDIAGFIRPDGVSLAQIDMIFAQEKSDLRRRFFEF